MSGQSTGSVQGSRALQYTTPTPEASHYPTRTTARENLQANPELWAQTSSLVWDGDGGNGPDVRIGLRCKLPPFLLKLPSITMLIN